MCDFGAGLYLRVSANTSLLRIGLVASVKLFMDISENTLMLLALRVLMMLS